MPFEADIHSIGRGLDFLYKCAERTDDGDLYSELIGTYPRYKYEIDCRTPEDYSRLYEKLTEPVPFHDVIVPGTDYDYPFRCYMGSIEDKLVRQRNGKNYWSSLTVEFKAKAPNRRPL